MGRLKLQVGATCVIYRSSRTIAAVAGWLLLASSAVAQQFAAPSPTGQPSGFSGVAGKYYQIKTTADRSEVPVEDPIILTLEIAGKGPQEYAPKRERLDVLFRRLRDDFYVEPLPSKGEPVPFPSLGAEAQVWRFRYALRPKRVDIERIPGLRLWYWDGRRYILTPSSSIPISVTPRPAYVPDAETVARPDERFLQIDLPATTRSRSRAWFGRWALLLLLIPPLACAWCYGRRRGSTRQQQRKRSRAANLALRSLRAQSNGDVRRITRLVSDYLAARVGLESNDPTPDEVEKRLRRVGVSPDVRRRMVAFFADSDMARFAPGSQATAVTYLADEARQAVESMEGELCLR